MNNDNERMERLLMDEFEGDIAPRILCNCCMCDYEIWSTEAHYEIEGAIVCEDCGQDFIDKFCLVYGEEY